MSGLAYDLQARVRAKSDVVSDLGTGEPAPLVINPRGDLLVAYGMPGVAELVRMRQSYFALGTAAAPANAALPTTATATGITLWNGEQENGRIYVIDSIGFYVVVSAAAATAVGCVVCINLGKKTTPTADITPRGLAGNVYRGTGVVDLNATIVDDKWFPYGTSVVGPASQIGLAGDYPVDGLFVIPPGHQITVGVIANTATTITCRSMIRWHEVQLPVG